MALSHDDSTINIVIGIISIIIIIIIIIMLQRPWHYALPVLVDAHSDA